MADFSLDNEKQFNELLEQLKARGKIGFQSETRLTKYIVESKKREYRLKEIKGED